MQISIPIADTMEYINAKEISPLISKGVCKVCYVGQEPNRNGTVITKEVATEMGRKLPGSPVVGYYNKETGDFEEHSKEIVLQNGKFEIVDITRPYGFVPTNADVWFEKFDDGGVEHEYLVAEVYIWTGAYPESKRIIEQGNNQSMEINRKTEKGFWANHDKTNARIFIYNEALIEKLCILGENVEPCFEGAQINSTFSLEGNPEFQEFKTTMFSMLTELQETLNKGGSQEPMEENNKLNPENEEFKQKNPTDQPGNPPQEEPKEPEKDKKKPEEENACKKKYNLEEVTEYVELQTRYNELETKYSALEGEKATLDTEVQSLREFKLEAERLNKKNMIDSFYMLSDDDKKDIVEHMDTYSLDDIEAKLSILCVRNKVDFNLDPQGQEKIGPQGLFNLNNVDNDTAPEWIKRIRETAKKQ